MWLMYSQKILRTVRFLSPGHKYFADKKWEILGKFEEIIHGN